MPYAKNYPFHPRPNEKDLPTIPPYIPGEEEILDVMFAPQKDLISEEEWFRALKNKWMLDPYGQGLFDYDEKGRNPAGNTTRDPLYEGTGLENFQLRKSDMEENMGEKKLAQEYTTKRIYNLLDEHILPGCSYNLRKNPNIDCWGVKIFNNKLTNEMGMTAPYIQLYLPFSIYREEDIIKKFKEGCEEALKMEEEMKTESLKKKAVQYGELEDMAQGFSPEETEEIIEKGSELMDIDYKFIKEKGLEGEKYQKLVNANIPLSDPEANEIRKTYLDHIKERVTEKVPAVMYLLLEDNNYHTLNEALVYLDLFEPPIDNITFYHFEEWEPEKLSHKANEEKPKSRADEMWEKMDDNEQFGCQFGMFPQWLYDEYKPTHEEIVELMGMGSPNVNASKKVASNPTVAEVLNSDDEDLKQAFVRLIGDAVVVNIEPHTKELTDEDYDRISDKIYDLKSQLIEKYPDKDFVEINIISSKEKIAGYKGRVIEFNHNTCEGIIETSWGETYDFYVEEPEIISPGEYVEFNLIEEDGKEIAKIISSKKLVANGDLWEPKTSIDQCDIVYENDDYMIIDKFDYYSVIKKPKPWGDAADIVVDKLSNEVLRQFSTRAEVEKEVENMKAGEGTPYREIYGKEQPKVNASKKLAQLEGHYILDGDYEEIYIDTNVVQSLVSKYKGEHKGFGTFTVTIDGNAFRFDPVGKMPETEMFGRVYSVEGDYEARPLFISTLEKMNMEKLGTKKLAQESEKIYWKDIPEDGVIQIDKSTNEFYFNGKLIYWHGDEKEEAMSFLDKHEWTYASKKLAQDFDTTKGRPTVEHDEPTGLGEEKPKDEIGEDFFEEGEVPMGEITHAPGEMPTKFPEKKPIEPERNLLKQLTPMDMKEYTAMVDERSRAEAQGDLSKADYLNNAIRELLNKYKESPGTLNEMSPASFVGRKMKAHTMLNKGDYQKIIKSVGEKLTELRRDMKLKISSASVYRIDRESDEKATVDFTMDLMMDNFNSKNIMVRAFKEGDVIEIHPYFWDSLGREYHFDEAGIKKLFNLQRTDKKIIDEFKTKEKEEK